MKIVTAKMKRIHVQQTMVNMCVQSALASSNISPCLSHFKIREIPPKSPNESLFKNRYITIGSIISAIKIIASAPQELLIMPRLAETVRNASFIEAPTIGTKELIAKRAVLIVSVSAPWEITFFKERINIKTDIINIVTEVNVVLMSLEIPPNSIPPIDLTQLKTIQILTSGSIHATNKTSVREINNTIAPLLIAAVDIFPLSICIVAIIGAKDDIVLQRILVYAVTLLARDTQILNTYIITQIDEQEENAICIASDVVVCENISKIELKSKSTSIPLKTFNVLFNPTKRYSMM